MASFPRTQGNTTAKGQIDKCNELLHEVADTNGEYANQVWADLKARWAQGNCTFEFVSAQISAMIEAKKAARELDRARITQNVPQIPDGRYAVTGSDGTTKFYRVTTKGGYKLFVYASDNQHIVKPWRVVLAVLRQIDADGVQAAALRFGTELGRCFTCGRLLTDETSRSVGQGPDCRSK